MLLVYRYQQAIFAREIILSTLLQNRLKAIASSPLKSLLGDVQRGIEKESLRIRANGLLAKTPHPVTLGSALSHPKITTDYSEALLEFITGVHGNIDDCLAELDQIQRFVYSQLNDELLWTSSMPCVLEGDQNIPVAQYGSSNVAKMKTVYRLGLGHRYGRLMQTIAGIHYNFSLPDSFWQLYQQQEADQGSLQDFKTTHYFKLIRNFRRYSWLLVYLFGASPSVCQTFLKGRDHHLQTLVEGTLGMPYGTSLRMGDLGYQSSAQEHLNVSYNSLEQYTASLLSALTCSHPDYEKTGLKQNGEYQQLNTSLLQIENEFYSSIRPKRVIHSGETPLQALSEKGVEYIEVRCLDVNPYLPLGINAEQIRFIDSFLLFCLLQDSPEMDLDEDQRAAQNLTAVVERGRDPELQLTRNTSQCSFKDYAAELMAGIEQVAELMDQADDDKLHSEAVAAQRAKLHNSELTPSAQILKQLSDNQQAYFKFAMQQARQCAADYSEQGLSTAEQAEFSALAKQSWQDQKAIEAADQLSFEQYLA